MADKKISALTSASTPLAGTEVLPIVQSGSTVKVATNDLTVRNIRANATTGILQVTGPTAATTRVVTVPDANFTAARTDAAQTFTGTQTIDGILNVTHGTGDQLLLNIKTNDVTAANNAGVGLRANSSATAANRFSQLWFDADGANLSGGDYFIVQKNGNDGSVDIVNYSPAVMRFAANYVGRAAIDLTIETTGNVTVNNGNLVIGTSGKGIDFSADGNAAGMSSELLDDYEEGTWSPVLTDSVHNATMSVNTFGKYTKVGRLVTCTAYIETTSLGSISAAIYIAGWPFSIGTSGGCCASYGANLSITAGTNVTLTRWGSTLMRFMSWDSTGGTSYMTSSIWTATGAIYISATYEV
jgi:hypothetical protein